MSQKIRLYKYLLEKNKTHKWGYTEAAVKKNITNLGVYIGEELIFSHLAWVYQGLDASTSPNIDHWPKTPTNRSKLTKPISNYILYEDDNLIVFDKPKGLVVDGGSGQVDELAGVLGKI